MAFSRKNLNISYRAAGLIVFLCGYVSAAVTTAIFFDILAPAVLFVLCLLLLSAVFMTIAFAVAQRVGRTDVVDIAWGLLPIVLISSGWLFGVQEFEIGFTVQTAILLAVMLWGLRLAAVLFIRIKNRPEDERYRKLRAKWRGNTVANTYSRIFLLQGVLAVIISAAAIIVIASPSVRLDWVGYTGVAIWCVGFLFEVIGDWQLARFQATPKNKGKLLTTGLWRYTRHPNYFGEAAMWWGIFIMALSTEFGWLGIVSPIVITYLLLFVSGVPMAETALRSRKGWKQYVAKTSKFLPLPPKEV